MLFEELLELELDKVNHIGFLDKIHLVKEDEDVSDSDLPAEKDMLFGLGHGSVDSGNHEDTCIHLCCSSDHVLDVVDVSWAIDVGVMAGVGLILNSSSVDGDTSGLLFGGLVDLSVLYVLGFCLVGQVLGDGGCEGGLSVIDVADGSD